MPCRGVGEAGSTIWSRIKNQSPGNVGLWVLSLFKEVSWYCCSQSTKVPDRLSSLLYSALSLLTNLHVSEISLAGSRWHNLFRPCSMPSVIDVTLVHFLSMAVLLYPTSDEGAMLRKSRQLEFGVPEILLHVFFDPEQVEDGHPFHSSIKPIMWFLSVG